MRPRSSRADGVGAFRGTPGGDLGDGSDHDINAAELHRITGGNPFFVTEVIASGSIGIPLFVRDAVLGRLARLPAATRLLADVAACDRRHNSSATLRGTPSGRRGPGCSSSGRVTSSGGDWHGGL
jgi:hypothetical protein